MTTHFYTATSLDGFIATTEHSLEWLFAQDFDMEGPMAYPAFVDGIGALVMGASTYEWLLRSGEPWGYTQPTWVLTHRELHIPKGADIRLTQAGIVQVHEEMTAAAGGKDLWIAGGGGVAAEFAAAGLLDEVWIQYAPVMLGAGQPSSPGGSISNS
ncbi:dihydrofolate reductase family protein [Leucobacter soli]|uniref:dihydrofolate reductase family protein n=1 Tax=Leucobacter soli TaxID=2812850 RepID=UPI003606926F